MNRVILGSRKNRTVLILVSAFVIIIIGKIFFVALEYIAHFSFTDVFEMVSSQLQSDQKGRSNILLLGTGGGEHEGANLTDTIMIASLSAEKKTASLLSIPRDLWLDMPGYGSSRINKVYEILKPKYGSEQALDIVRRGVEMITNLSIPYYLKVDFESFEKTIDALGGIEVMVEKSIFDQQFPDDEKKVYTTFSLEAGLHSLDGETALKYVRSRHSTSDFDRSFRQQQVLRAIKEKVKSMNFFISPLLVRKLLNEYEDHVETNLKLTELITLANLGGSMSSKNISTAVLKDIEIIQEGSFLYTPTREQYGGAFVLIPVGESYKDIQRFISILFDAPQFFQEKASIEILNGTKRFGLAAQIGQKLIPFGFHVEHYGNAKRTGSKTIQKTSYVIHHPENTLETEKLLRHFFPYALKKKETFPPSSSYDITVVLGEDSDLSTF